MHPYRTHNCGELKSEHTGKSVRLSGWVHRARDHGGLLFIDLRDHYGITQCVASPESAVFETAQALRPESVISVEGAVVLREQETVNPQLPTGKVEMQIEKLTIISAAEDLPLPVFAEPAYPEDLRLLYRFLDLRRASMHERIVLRAAIIASLRRRMEGAGFMEFQTPILTASSPEGARDFLVPSRLHQGRFYALPQAPQIFKQLAILGGFDRYFQIAPCFRDEDARADRSPGEFYQLDVEMAFATQEDVFGVMEPLLHGLFEEFAGARKVLPMPFPRIPYKDAMLHYGSDKPDLRNPLKIVDVSEEFAAPDVSFRAFQNLIQSGAVVRAIPAPRASQQPRSFFDSLNDWARTEMRAPGLGYIIFDDKMEGQGPIAKFVPPARQKAMAQKANLSPGDALFFACAQEKQAALLAGAARQEIARRLSLIPKDVFSFCWVTDMPMFAWNEEEQKIDFSHNPFSMPLGGLDALTASDPLEIVGQQYDIVCNGVELSSGAIRNHDLETLFKSFEVAGYAKDEVKKRFPALTNALRFGAPPHGGIAPGIDRIVMLLADTDNLRDVVMFPMNQRAEDALMGAPSEVDEKRLRELHLRLLPPEKKSASAKSAPPSKRKKP